MTILGIISDTHIPDKARRLNPRTLEIFREANVSAILHAGDISTPGVLEQLSEIAPVHAVRGNRDWVYLSCLPLVRTIAFDDVTIGLAHGHGGGRHYLIGKIRYIAEGYRLERFKKPLLALFPTANVIVFGHTHQPAILWVNGTLIFNPGSPCCADKDVPPSVGLLCIQAGGDVKGEIVTL